MNLLHPLLFALFLVVSAYKEVCPDGDPWEAVRCVPAPVLIALALFGGFRLGARDARKAALLATVALFYLGLSGEIQITLKAFFLKTRWPFLGNALFVLILLSLLTAAVAVAIFRTKRNMGPLNRAVQAAVAAILAMALGGLWLDRRDRDLRAAVSPLPLKLETQGRPPDIYFIVLDSFTSLDSLRDYWGYEPAELNAFFKENGFHVEPAARSAYQNTLLCLASRLNMRHPPESCLDMENRFNRKAMLHIIRHSAAPALLTAAGYKIVNLSMMTVGTEPGRYQILTFFSFGSVRQAIQVRSILSFRKKVAVTRMVEGRKFRKAARKIRQPLSDLEKLIAERSDRPRFVFVHSMMTHDPYMFNRDGSLHESMELIDAPNSAYLDQLIYTTEELIRVVRLILRSSERPPVIVIQWDHGFRCLKGNGAAKEKETYSMLNAYLLPGADGHEAGSGLDPVNTFRLVFNRVFNAGLPSVTNRVPVRAEHPENPED